MIDESDEPMPPYAYVPGGPWPHPNRSPGAEPIGRADPIAGDDWAGSPLYRCGVRLFNAGYYWEAHEAWEAVWHAQGRRGPAADLLRALIKLAAAGVKVRERQPRGVATHARRASVLLRSLRADGPRRLGLDLDEWAAFADRIAEGPPADPGPRDARVTIVFAERLAPR